MDDASARIFRELARPAIDRLVSIGPHAGLQESAWQLRHVWATTAQAHDIGELLTSRFIHRHKFRVLKGFSENHQQHLRCKVGPVSNREGEL
jgi:hypothetical protein